MKKILMIAILMLVSTMSLCSAAFQPPNPERWITIAEDEKSGCWYDKETIRFITETKSYSPCYKHKIVRSWVIMYEAEDVKSPVLKIYTDFDLTCRTTKENHIIVCDENYKQIESVDVSYISPKPVVPESIGEYIISVFDKEWQKYHEK